MPGAAPEQGNVTMPAENVVQPDSMADYLSGKAMTVAQVGRGFMPTLSPVASPTARPD
jgi:hypothetical protein